MLVYLGGQIDAATKDEARNWREEATRYLTQRGASVYNPALAFSVGNMLDERIGSQVWSVNRGALFAADFVLINLSSGKMSIGSPREIEARRFKDTPIRGLDARNPHPRDLSVVVVVPANCSTFIGLHDVLVVTALETAYAHILGQTR